MSIVLTHNEYLELSDRSKRYRQQRDALAEALAWVADMQVGEYVDAYTINRARAALKQLEEE